VGYADAAPTIPELPSQGVGLPPLFPGECALDYALFVFGDLTGVFLTINAATEQRLAVSHILFMNKYKNSYSFMNFHVLVTVCPQHFLT
jgi:hypothetical protein